MYLLRITLYTMKHDFYNENYYAQLKRAYISVKPRSCPDWELTLRSWHCSDGIWLESALNQHFSVAKQRCVAFGSTTIQLRRNSFSSALSWLCLFSYLIAKLISNCHRMSTQTLAISTLLKPSNLFCSYRAGGKQEREFDGKMTWFHYFSLSLYRDTRKPYFCWSMQYNPKRIHERSSRR